METNEQQSSSNNRAVPDWSALFRIGGFASFALILYSVLTIVQVIFLGGQPSSAEESFRLLQTDRLVALLRLDLPTIAILPLYYLVFLSLYQALKGTNRTVALLATVLAFTGNTLVLSTPTALSLIPLSDKYAAATGDVARSQLIAAGEALMAGDIWHSTGAILGGVLMQSGAVLISIAMLRNRVFGRFTAWMGVAMHGLDLAHVLVGAFLPATSAVLLAIAGPLYPVWFFLIGRRLLQLASRELLPSLNTSPHSTITL